jgi:hypothetical protein
MLHEEKQPSEPCEDKFMLDTESASSEDSHLPNPRGLEQDRFELLSAYLDGEGTPAERKLVQQWLETDPQVQELYNRLLKLRYNLQNMEITAIQKSPEHLCQMVFNKIDQSRRKRKVLLWGGGAIAALVVGSLTSIFTGDQSPSWQFANSIAPNSLEKEEELVIALNRPIINMNYQARKIDTEALMLPLTRPPVPIPQAAMSGK